MNLKYKIDYSVGDSVYYSVRNSVCDSVRGSVGDSVRGSVNKKIKEYEFSDDFNSHKVDGYSYIIKSTFSDEKITYCEDVLGANEISFEQFEATYRIIYGQNAPQLPKFAVPVIDSVQNILYENLK